MPRGAIKYKVEKSTRSKAVGAGKSAHERLKQPTKSFPSTPEWITDRGENATTPIFFWKPHEDWGFLGQWYPSFFRSPPRTDCNDGPDCPQCEAERKNFICCEQYMMYQKALLFNDTKTAEHILATDDPGQMKALGRKVKGFNDYTWDQRKFDIVVEANLLKFGVDDSCEADDNDGFAYGGLGREKNQQRVRLRELLLSTGTRELVEASALDRIWGIGFSQTQARCHGEEERACWGKNLLGKALMQVREWIRRQEEGLAGEQAGQAGEDGDAAAATAA